MKVNSLIEKLANKCLGPRNLYEVCIFPYEGKLYSHTYSVVAKDFDSALAWGKKIGEVTSCKYIKKVEVI